MAIGLNTTDSFLSKCQKTHQFHLALSMRSYGYCICMLKFNKLHNSQNRHSNVLIITLKVPVPNPSVHSSIYACIATSHTHACIVGPISRPRPKSSDPPLQIQHTKISPRKITPIFVPYAQGIISYQDQDFMHLGSTPIKISVLEQYLATYPDIQNAQFLLNGFKSGFYLNYIGPRAYLQSKNMKSASEHADQLLAIIEKEITLGRMSGPFSQPPFPNIRCNPVGVLPKKDGGYRLISNLSAPIGNSVNEHIDPILCSVSYASFDQAISMIQENGKGALLCKMDLSSAFRLLPIHPSDFPLLGICFQEKYYFDRCMPFGCSIACSSFEKFSSFLHWLVAQKSQNYNIIHYLDDFLFVGEQNTLQCSKLAEMFMLTCSELGVPINDKKTEGPCTRLSFLGLGIDTIDKVIFIPDNKVAELRSKLSSITSSKKVTLKEMESLCGSLNFFAKAIPGSRAFNRRFYNTTIGIRKHYHLIKVTQAVKEDARIWLTFLDQYNGRSPFPELYWSDNETLNLFTDSCGSYGGGAIFQNHWVVISWPESWGPDIRRDITFLELVPILVAMWIWADQFTAKKLLINTDNIALVDILNAKSSKSQRVMSLVRPLVLLCMKNNIQIKTRHIPGYQNSIADSISRFQWERFRSLAPQADKTPARLPPELLSLLDPM